MEIEISKLFPEIVFLEALFIIGRLYKHRIEAKI